MRKEHIVSVSYTYLSDNLEPVEAVYVFNENGMIKRYDDTNKHEQAFAGYDVSGCYDWYFVNEQEFYELLEKCKLKYYGIEALNSYIVGVLSYERYGDFNCIRLREKDLYVGTDKNYYVFLESDGHDTLFISFDDLKCLMECDVYKNINVIANVGNYFKDIDFDDFDYKINKNRVFLKKIRHEKNFPPALKS